MYRSQSLFGPMMRHGSNMGYPGNAHSAGTSSVEWAILGLAIAILIGVVLLLADRSKHGHRHHGHGWGPSGGFDKPLTILRLRYSQGEITRDEYLQASRDLGGAPQQEESPAAEHPPAESRRRGRK